MKKKMSFYDIKRILKPYHTAIPTDDFRIINSWADYEEDDRVSIEERPLEYLCYELEAINPDTGEVHHFYKAIRFLRIRRLPKSAKQSMSLMDMQAQILAGVYEEGINFITVIANIKKPVALGLLYLYGVQGIGKTIEEAKEKAHYDFLRIVGMFQGTFRVLEMKIINAQETEWLRKKLYGMEYMTVVRGIPKASNTGEDAGNKGFGGSNLNPSSHGTLEELIIGLTDYEYVLEVLSTPVQMSTLKAWSLKTQTEMTDWYTQLQGQTSFSANISIPMMYGANAGTSSGWSQAYTDAESVNYSQGESFTNTVGESLSESLSESFGQTHSVSNGFTHSISNGITEGITEGTSIGISQSNSTGSGISQGLSTSSNFSENVSNSQSLSQSTSMSMGNSQSNSLSHTLGSSENNTINHSVGTSQNVTDSVSMNESNSINIGNTHSTGTTESMSTGLTESVSESQGLSQGTSDSIGSSTNSSHTDNASFSSSEQSFVSGLANIIGVGNLGVDENGNAYDSATWGSSDTSGTGTSKTQGTSQSVSETTSESHSMSQTTSNSLSNTDSTSVTSGHSVSNGVSHGTSMGTSESMSYGSSSGVSESYGVSNGQTLSSTYGTSMGLSDSVSTGQSISNGYGSNVGISENASYSEGINQSHSTSKSTSVSQSVSDSVSNSVSDSVSNTTSKGVTSGTSKSISNGTSQSTSTGNSYSSSNGTSGTVTSGVSSSLGLGPSIGYSKSHQWIDQKVKDILELLEFQNERAKKALRSNGAFYTYVYLATSNMDALATAQAVAKSTWQNEMAMVSPLQVLDLDMDEQKHLLYHFSAFSSDVTKELVEGVEEYKYSTILLNDEFVAYTHLPRVSEGGIYADVEDIPKLAVPSMLKGEIYMGTVVSAEKYTLKKGNITDFDYRIDEAELMHGFFTGASRSGKSVAAMRFIGELAKIRRKHTGKRLRIVCMDPKQDWRGLARFVEPERFNFYSLGNLNYRPIKLNPWKVPKGVSPQIWIDGVIDIYCRAYGLLERGKQMIAETVYALYEEAGVFKALDKPNWKEVVPELSKSVNFTAIQKKMEETRDFLESSANTKGKMGNDTRDAYSRLLERMAAFKREFSIEHIMYGTSDGIGVDELIGADDVTILESKGLENTFKNFIFGVITSGFYKFAIAHEGGYLAPDQYETILVIEEANEILTGNDSAGGGQMPSLSGQSEFEQMLDQAAGYGLFIFAITQKIADMPSSIIANSGMIFAGRLNRPEDVTTVIRAIGREDKFEDRDLVKWFPKSPTGWFICRSARGYDFKTSEPIMVQIARLNTKHPTNAELEEILVNKETALKIKEAS